jgi:hypothetical protein
LSEQPTGALAERAKLAASLNNQERVGWDCPTRSTAALATANWQPYQNVALPEAYGTDICHRLTLTESANLWRIRRHSGPSGKSPGHSREDHKGSTETLCEGVRAYSQSAGNAINRKGKQDQRAKAVKLVPATTRAIQAPNLARLARSRQPWQLRLHRPKTFGGLRFDKPA